MKQHEMGGWVTVKWRCEQITKVDMKQARLIQPSQDDIENAYGQLTIQFTSKQSFAAYNSKGKLVAGDPDKIVRSSAPHSRRASRLLVRRHEYTGLAKLSHATGPLIHANGCRRFPSCIPEFFLLQKFGSVSPTSAAVADNARRHAALTLASSVRGAVQLNVVDYWVLERAVKQPGARWRLAARINP